MQTGVASNVASTACTRAVLLHRLLDGIDDQRVAAHAEVVVAAPHRHVLVVARLGVGVVGRDAVDVVKVAVALVALLLVDFLGDEAVVVKLVVYYAHRGGLLPQ